MDQIRKMEAAQGMTADGHRERSQRAYEEVSRRDKCSASLVCCSYLVRKSRVRSLRRRRNSKQVTAVAAVIVIAAWFSWLVVCPFLSSWLTAFPVLLKHCTGAHPIAHLFLVDFVGFSFCLYVVALLSSSVRLDMYGKRALAFPLSPLLTSPSTFFAPGVEEGPVEAPDGRQDEADRQQPARPGCRTQPQGQPKAVS